AKAVEAKLKAMDMRVHLDERSETVNYRIREAQMQQVPYMVVIGDKEVEDNVVAIRHRRQGNLGTMTVEALAEKLKQEIANKENN
ncbi:MAG: hypothetical protein KA794_18120, partial [Candidatus Obscuribacter sp.]|nr:hypothetical protein [Candidatus Obscuribacter sp.]